MAPQKTGLVFRSVLGTPEMAKRLKLKFPEMTWRLGDSDLYRYYYVMGKRYDGVIVKIMPENESNEYYLGVYFGDMPEFPKLASNSQSRNRSRRKCSLWSRDILM